MAAAILIATVEVLALVRDGAADRPGPVVILNGLLRFKAIPHGRTLGRLL